MSFVYAIIGLFALAAIIGMYLITFVLRNKETPKALAFVHGIFAAAAIILLCVYVSDEGPDLTESLVLFIVAALGGFVLIARDLTGRTIPKWLAVMHGLLAVSGFVFLLIRVFGR